MAEQTGTSLSAALQSMRDAASRGRFRGWVVPTSGGVDSALALHLACLAHGSGRVIALSLPERHSEDASSDFALAPAQHLGAEYLRIDLSAALSELGCYDRQERAIAGDFPGFDSGLHLFRAVYKEDYESAESLPEFRLQVLEGASGNVVHDRAMSPACARRLVGATNMKQRLRMLVAHAEAESRGYGVVNTSNRVEWEQGFLVRYGDATGDVYPLRHLLKSEVYELAREVGVLPKILARTPTTDTYSAPQTQEDFYFGLPLIENDTLWEMFCNGTDADSAARRVGRSVLYVENVFRSYQRRSAVAARIHRGPDD